MIYVPYWLGTENSQTALEIALWCVTHCSFTRRLKLQMGKTVIFRSLVISQFKVMRMKPSSLRMVQLFLWKYESFFILKLWISGRVKFLFRHQYDKTAFGDILKQAESQAVDPKIHPEALLLSKTPWTVRFALSISGPSICITPITSKVSKLHHLGQ